PYLSDQWYLKVTDERLAGAALRAMSADQRDPHSPSPCTQGEGRGEGSSAAALGKGTLSPSLSLGTGRGSKAWQSKLRFYPARYAKTFQSWHENIRDWCISRQLWWGHRIPVWRLPEGRLADRLGNEEFAAAVAGMHELAQAGRVAIALRADAPDAP